MSLKMDHTMDHVEENQDQNQLVKENQDKEVDTAWKYTKAMYIAFRTTSRQLRNKETTAAAKMEFGQLFDTTRDAIMQDLKKKDGLITAGIILKAWKQAITKYFGREGPFLNPDQHCMILIGFHCSMIISI